MAQTPEIPLGHYVERIKSKVGTGDTAKKATMENYWRASEVVADQVRVELLDMHDELTGFVEWVPISEFLTRFEFAPEFAPRKVSLRQQQADRVAARAERHLEANEFLSAEFEFSNAIKLDEQNVRANFGLGKTYLATGQTDKAANIFRKLSTIEAVLDPENKHIFNEFGMSLRKMGLYVEAVRHYHRALSLTSGDENLWFNLGRALYEGGQHKQAMGAVKRALDINPNFEEARQYLQGIMQSSS
jgi:tetratricopeptide (TPR) repeat protein